jgi:hypothetical protein
MRIWAIFLFFVVFNISLYMIQASGVIGYSQAPYQSPGNISSQLVGWNVITNVSSVTGIIFLTVSAITALVLKEYVLGTAMLVIWTLGYLIPVVQWVLFGFPIFLAQCGVPAYIWVSLTTVISLCFFWFLLNFVGGKSIASTGEL